MLDDTEKKILEGCKKVKTLSIKSIILDVSCILLNILVIVGVFIFRNNLNSTVKTLQFGILLIAMFLIGYYLSNIKKAIKLWLDVNSIQTVMELYHKNNDVNVS